MASTDLLVKTVQKMDLKHGDFVVFECGSSVSSASMAELVKMVTAIGAARNIHLAAIVLRGDTTIKAVLRPSDVCAVCTQPLGDVRVGAGDGSMKDGGKFAHPECWKAKE